MLYWSKYIKKRKERYKARKKLRKNQRSWTAGRLVTFVSFDIFGKEHRFLCQMRKCHTDFREHRCAQCRTINHYRVCMNIGGEMCTKCMRKSDLACFPYKLRVLK